MAEEVERWFQVPGLEREFLPGQVSRPAETCTQRLMGLGNYLQGSVWAKPYFPCFPKLIQRN